MCMKREHEDYDKSGFPFPLFDIIDLTMEEIREADDIIEMMPTNDQWNYPYNLLPSSDDDETASGFILVGENDNITYDGLNVNTHEELTQNLNQSPDMYVSFNVNVTESNNANHSIENREFDLNIPQILLSMSRISNNLFERAAASLD